MTWRSALHPMPTWSSATPNPVSGRDNIRQSSIECRASLAGLEHQVVRAWRVDDTIIAQLLVTYRCHDGTTLTLPCANIFDLNSDGLIRRYQIFMDVNPVFA
jgi:hypothetical protein